MSGSPNFTGQGISQPGRPRSPIGLQKQVWKVRGCLVGKMGSTRPDLSKSFEVFEKSKKKTASQIDFTERGEIYKNI